MNEISFDQELADLMRGLYKEIVKLRRRAYVIVSTAVASLLIAHYRRRKDLP